MLHEKQCIDTREYQRHSYSPEGETTPSASFAVSSEARPTKTGQCGRWAAKPLKLFG